MATRSVTQGPFGSWSGGRRDFLKRENISPDGHCRTMSQSHSIVDAKLLQARYDEGFSSLLICSQ